MMKVLILCVVLASASAQWWPSQGVYLRSAPAPVAWAAPAPVAWAAPAPLASQYHAQDEIGQASYGYAYPGQAAANYQDAWGNQVGSYAYVDPAGKEVRVSYVADSNGFRVLSNNLPVAPAVPETPELKAPVFEGKAPVFDGKAPEPVEDTPEVVAAKAEFAKLFKEAADAAEAAPDTRKKRQILYSTGLPYYAVAPAPLLAKQTVKTLALEVDKDAKTPAATTLLETKERNVDVLTPLAIQAPLAYSYPVLRTISPIAIKAERKKRQILPIWSGINTINVLPTVRLAAPAPLLAKQTLKTVTLEADKDAKTPAATTLLENKERNIEVLTPVAYPTAYTIW